MQNLHLIKKKENALISVGNDDINSEIQIQRQKTFQQQWLDIAQFKPWLGEVPHDKQSFFCFICNKSRRGGLSEIYRHAQSQTHIKICKKNKVERNIGNENNEDIEETEECCLSLKDRKKAAEIRYAALIAETNISYRTAKDILRFFQSVGKDVNVLQSMTMNVNKCQSIISNVICPVETDRVVKDLRNTKFAVFIDETSDICNEKWMTFLVRYVDSETLDIRTQLVKLINIDATDCSANKIFNAFKSEMSKLSIPFTNIVALACDNASVMTGKHLSFKKKLEEMCENVLTFSCPCHSAALAAHAACLKIPESCEDFLKKIANYIHGSPKRSAIYREFSESFQERNKKIFKFCTTRWLSRHSCVTRILEGWDTITLFLNEMVVSDKTKSAEYFLCIMNNGDTKAYLLFLKYILHFFNSFHAFFQASETRIHVLQPRCADFLFQVCKNFLKQEHLESSITNNTFSVKENQKALDEITLGIECEEYLNELMMQGYKDTVTTVRENCLAFYVTAAQEIHKRLPVNDLFLSKLNILGPSITFCDVNREISFNDLSFIAKSIGDFDDNTLKEEWMALPSHFTVEEKQSLSTLHFDDMWKQILKCQYANNIDKYPNLKHILNAVRVLPNSNADAERAFSMLTDIKTKKRNALSSDSVNTLCVLKSALKSRKENVLEMQINAEHLSLMSKKTLYKKNPYKKSSLTLYPACDIAGPSSHLDMQL